MLVLRANVVQRQTDHLDYWVFHSRLEIERRLQKERRKAAGCLVFLLRIEEC